MMKTSLYFRPTLIGLAGADEFVFYKRTKTCTKFQLRNRKYFKKLFKENINFELFHECQ